MTQWYQALILRALRRVIKKDLGIEFGLVDMFNKIQESYKTTADKVIKKYNLKIIKVFIIIILFYIINMK